MARQRIGEHIVKHTIPTHIYSVCHFGEDNRDERFNAIYFECHEIFDNQRNFMVFLAFWSLRFAKVDKSRFNYGGRHYGPEFEDYFIIFFEIKEYKFDTRQSFDLYIEYDEDVNVQERRVVLHLDDDCSKPMTPTYTITFKETYDSCDDYLGCIQDVSCT